MEHYRSNILDPIQPTLPPHVWEHPESPEPILRPVHAHFITQHTYSVLERGGYPKPHQWLRLYMTGSLCTYQYSDASDCDVSLFILSDKLPEWSRAEMIGLMIEGTDGVTLPGTPHELQAYVVNKDINPTDLFKRGLRAGYSINNHRWVSPPDHRLSHDVEAQENGFYTWALEQADKMERLLRYEPDKATQFWHQIHKRRMRDEMAGKGDFSEANIIYKFLTHRGLLPEIAQVSGEHIANTRYSYFYGSDRTAPYITEADLSSPTAIERGLSRAVTPEEFQQLAELGKQRYNEFAANALPTGGLDMNWPGLVDQAFRETRHPWGGMTIDSHTGQPLRHSADAYALTVRPPGMDTVSVHPQASSEEFADAMNRAKSYYDPILQRQQHHLGIFHDADLGRIDFDPVLVVDNPEDVESIGAHTNAVGGAYHFQSGNGYWPPHVPSQYLEQQYPYDEGTPSISER